MTGISFIIEEVMDNNLLFNEYVFLEMLYYNKTELASKIASDLAFDIRYDSLAERGYMRLDEKDDEYYLTSKFADVFKSSPDFYDEFKSIYPEFTPENRPLHGSDEKLRKKYKSIVTSKKLHNHIIQCLQYEIQARKNNPQDGLKFMSGMQKYLNDRLWTLWENKLVSTNTAQTIRRSNLLGD